MSSLEHLQPVSREKPRPVSLKLHLENVVLTVTLNLQDEHTILMNVYVMSS